MLDRLTAGIVRIQGSRGLGTAFIITRDGLALTNHHVVARQRNLVARFQDNSVASVRVVRSDENADVALIQIDCVQDCVTVPLGSESQIATGSDVYALGHPSGLTASVSRGIVSGLRLMSGVTLLQTDAALNSGNSGGPIVDVASGQAVAIVSFKLTETEGLGFAIVIDDALRVLGLRVSSGQEE